MNNKEMGEMWEFNTFALDYSKRLLSKLIPTFVVTPEHLHSAIEAAGYKGSNITLEVSIISKEYGNLGIPV